MKFIKERNTYIFIAAVICLTAVDVILWKQLSLVRKLVTVFAMLAAAAITSIVQLNAHGMVSDGGYVAGAVLMIFSFICMDMVIILGFGKKPSEIIGSVRSQNNK